MFLTLQSLSILSGGPAGRPPENFRKIPLPRKHTWKSVFSFFEVLEKLSSLHLTLLIFGAVKFRENPGFPLRIVNLKKSKFRKKVMVSLISGVFLEISGPGLAGRPPQNPCFHLILPFFLNFGRNFEKKKWVLHRYTTCYLFFDFFAKNVASQILGKFH